MIVGRKKEGKERKREIRQGTSLGKEVKRWLECREGDQGGRGGKGIREIGEEALL